MAEVSAIFLLDGMSGEAVDAELRDAIEEAQLIDWQTRWQPAMIETLRTLSDQGVPLADWPQSWHWDWRKKTAGVSGLLAFPGFSVVAQGITQGLAQVDLTRSARAPEHAGKPMAYVDYLEVAPWNRPDLGQPLRLKGVGTALLTAIVAQSDAEGFKGRIGLHSLPQADGFYRRWGFIDLGLDAACQGLRYFEMTAEQARAFLEEE
jgi:GNAT superfamily N-acetyltransferase